MNFRNYLCAVKFDQWNYDKLKHLFNVRQILRSEAKKTPEAWREYKIIELQCTEEEHQEFLQWLADNTMISDNPNFSKVMDMFVGMATGYKRIKPPESKKNMTNHPNIYLLAERELNKDENKP
jgi:hypothetical protein